MTLPVDQHPAWDQWTRYWATRPHIRFGDPCYGCSVAPAPASRRWSSWTLPPGVRKHAGLGLCGACAGRLRRGLLGVA